MVGMLGKPLGAAEFHRRRRSLEKGCARSRGQGEPFACPIASPVPAVDNTLICCFFSSSFLLENYSSTSKRLRSFRPES